MRRWATVAVAACGALAAACSSHGHATSPTPAPPVTDSPSVSPTQGAPASSARSGLVMFNGYATSLAAVNAVTLARDPDRTVKLGDSSDAGFAGPSFVISPDGRQIAVPRVFEGRL